MSFGDIIRTANSPNNNPEGIGGNNNVIWHCGAQLGIDIVYELSVIDFSVIKSASSPGGIVKGIGGDSTTIWHCDQGTDKVYELSTVDFSVVRSASTPSAWPFGIGGDSTTIWHADTGTDKVYELSTVDFSVVRSASTPTSVPKGMGGDSTTIWHCDASKKIYELSTVDFSIVRNVTFFSSTSGIGGNYNTLYNSNPTLWKVYELDAAYVPSTYTISGNVQDSNGNNLPNVSITLVDSINYSVSTDGNGDYSQVVNPDIYNVSALIPGNTDQSTSVDASASDQTQNFVFPVTTSPHDKAIRLKERYLLE